MADKNVGNDNGGVDGQGSIESNGGIPPAELSSESATLLKAQVLQDAAQLVLKGGMIPLSEPRVLTKEEVDALYNELRVVRDARTKELLGGNTKGMSAAHRVMKILHRASYQYTLAGFTNPDLWSVMAAPVMKAVSEGRKIGMAIPFGGGKVAVSLKTGGYIMPDLSEMVAHAMLDAIVMAIGEVYKPGAGLVVMPDLGLHTPDLGLSSPVYVEHMKKLVSMTNEVFASQNRVVYMDPLASLPSVWNETVGKGVKAARQKLTMQPTEGMLDLARSMVLSVNTLSEGRTFEEEVLMYASIANPGLEGLNQGIVEEGLALVKRAFNAAPQYIATSDAIRTTGILEKMVQAQFPGAEYFRLTVHPKPLEPRPFLLSAGKLAPKPGVLPMHSVGVRGAGDGKVRYGVAWALEARMKGWKAVHGPEGFMYFGVA